MIPFKYNKIAGIFLGTCLVGLGTGIIAGGIFQPGPPEKPGYALPLASPEAADSGHAAPVADTPLPVLLAKADAKHGEADTKVCQACHNFVEGAGTKVGPDLYGVVNRPKGSVPGFNYSAGMKAKGGNWTFADLNTFITKPSAYVDGTLMGYPGEENPAKRADIIAYLATLAKTPVPLPAVTADTKAPAAAAAPAAPAAAAAAAPASGADDELIKLIASSDPNKGHAYAQICSACHNLKQGGGVLVGPPLWGVVDRPKGSIAGFAYSDGMKAKGGKWTYADLNQFLTKPSAYVQGTKMGFAGEANPKKRAEVIAFLRTLAVTPPPLGAAPAAAMKPEPVADKAPAPVAAPAAAAPPAPPPAPEKKTEAAPPADAKPSDTASQGPEPYEGADPEPTSTPAAAASTTIETAPAKVNLGDAGGATGAPEPYAAPAPDDANAADAKPDDTKSSDTKPSDTASQGPEPYEGAEPDAAATPAAAASTTIETAPAKVNLGDAGGATGAPEPYSAPAPGEADKN